MTMIKEIRNKIILFFFPTFFDNFYESMDYVYTAFKYLLLIIAFVVIVFKRDKIFKFLKIKDNLSQSILSNTITRITLGVLALYNFMILYDPYIRYQMLELNYFPKGILQLLFRELPSYSIFQAIKVIGIIFSIFFILGILEYFSSGIIAVSLIFFASFNESIYQDYWGHGLNLQVIVFVTYFLAGGMNGYSISQKEFPNNLKSSNFTILILSFSTSLVFLNAFYWKIKNSGIDWALSDNAKYLLLTQRLYTYKEIEEYIYQIASYPVVYKFLMFGGLMSELLPIFFIFFIRKPLLRFLTVVPLALLLISFEYFLLLGGTLSWLLVLITFIDFEYLFKKEKVAYNLPVKTNKQLFTPLLLFFIVQIYIGFFTPQGTDYKLNSYPISQYPMFSVNYDMDPSIKGKDYFFTNVYFEIQSNSITEEKLVDLEKRISYPVNQYFRDFNFSQNENQILLAQVSDYLQSQEFDYEQIDMFFITYVIPQNLNNVPNHSSSIEIIEKNKFAEFKDDKFLTYDIGYSHNADDSNLTFDPLLSEKINSIDFITISTHNYLKESIEPPLFNLKEMDVINYPLYGYKQIVLNLRDGSKLTSGFCYGQSFSDC
jgi:hypothetical protein